MPNEPPNLWELYLKDFNFDDLKNEKIGPPEIEFERPTTKEVAKLKGKKVFVQKLITEIWIYTDLDGKTFAHKGTQDIVVAGEMDYEEALKLIGGPKTKRSKNPDT